MPAVAFEAAALFQIIDRASPTLRLLTEQMERLDALTTQIMTKFEALSGVRFSGLNRSLGTAIRNTELLNRESGQTNRIMAENEAISARSIKTAERARALTPSQIMRSQWALEGRFLSNEQILAARSRAGGIEGLGYKGQFLTSAQILAAQRAAEREGLAPRPSVAGRAGIPNVPLREDEFVGPWGPQHPLSEPRVAGGRGVQGGAHTRMGFPLGPGMHATVWPSRLSLGGMLGTATELVPLGIAGGLIYGAWERAGLLDQVNRILLAAGQPLGSPMRDQLTTLIGQQASATALPLGITAEALAAQMSAMRTVPLQQRMQVFPEFLRWARIENLITGGAVSAPEAMTTTIGLMHQWGQYSPQGMLNMMRLTSAIATLGPTMNIPEMERAAGYSATAAQVSGISPETIFTLIAANQIAGITSTKAGTWIESFIEALSPKGGLQTLLMTRQGVLRYGAMQKLGLFGPQGQPVAMQMLQQGNLEGLLELVHSHLMTIPSAQRMGILQQAVGSRQGAREMGRFFETSTGAQFQMIAQAFQTFAHESSEQVLKNWERFSPMFELQKAWVDIQKLLTDLARTILPGFMTAVKTFDFAVNKFDAAINAIFWWVGANTKSGTAALMNALPGLHGAVPPGIAGIHGTVGRHVPRAFPSIIPAAHAAEMVEHYESGGRNVVNYKYWTNPALFSASGYYQITNTNWRHFAPLAGLSLAQYPTAISAPHWAQERVFDEMYEAEGLSPWAPYNPRLAAAALSDSMRHSGVAPKGLEGSSGNLVPGGAIQFGDIHIHGDVLDADKKADHLLDAINKKLKNAITRTIGQGSGVYSSPYASGLGVNY